MTGAQAAGVPGREVDSAAASAVKALRADGRHAEARERFAEVVARHQRRAGRIAYHYLRDVAEADEAVQDAFIKAYTHLASFREELPFEVWFTRILVNGCLDRIKARTRRERWIVSMPDTTGTDRDLAERMPGHGPSPEDQLLAKERRERLAVALGRTARPAAFGVHVEPLRGVHIAGSERHHRAERIDGAGPLVSRD